MRASSKTKEKLGVKIQRLRKEHGYTQESFAETVGISRTHAGHIEKGRKSPSIKVLEKMARLFKIPLSELFNFK